MTTCHRPKREKASHIDELVRKHCCKMPSPKHPTAHRGGHMICFMWSTECGYEELAGCLDHFCYRLGSGAGSVCAADHLLAILVSTLPPCAAAAVLAVHRTFDHLELFERSLQKCTAASSRCALFEVGQASMDGRGREMYRKIDGASATRLLRFCPTTVCN